MFPRGLLVLVVLVAACAGTSESQPGDVSGPSVPSFAVDAAAEVTMRPDLNVLYRDCLLAEGFDPEGVQVLVGSSGVPYWVKTGHNVPAALHSPCFEAIGGVPTDAPSWGRGGP